MTVDQPDQRGGDQRADDADDGCHQRQEENPGISGKVPEEVT